MPQDKYSRGGYLKCQSSLLWRAIRHSQQFPTIDVRSTAPVDIHHSELALTVECDTKRVGVRPTQRVICLQKDTVGANKMHSASTSPQEDSQAQHVVILLSRWVVPVHVTGTLPHPYLPRQFNKE
jgi:hypothetical protein